jgi:Uri superfamily endonuclease
LKGIYALVIRLENDAALNVGALGMISFKKGVYIYVGSAQTNLELRVMRHLRKEKRLFWHIDYLLGNNAARVEKVFHMEDAKAAECVIASEIGKRGEPVISFGCSDCNCKSHLFRVENCDFLLGQMHLLKMEP